MLRCPVDAASVRVASHCAGVSGLSGLRFLAMYTDYSVLLMLACCVSIVWQRCSWIHHSFTPGLMITAVSLRQEGRHHRWNRL